MVNAPEQAQLDLSSLLDNRLDDIDDLPEYAAPPPGYYKLLVSKVESKLINEKPAMAVEYKVKEVLQLAETTDATGAPVVAPSVDMTFSEAFFFHAGSDIEKTKQVMKAKFGEIGKKLVGSDATLNQTMAKLADGTVLILANITNRKDKADHTKIYASTRDISLA